MILDIFPAGGFDTSILTIVFVGLIVRWMLTETLGFTFVGLVVPGYLASVFVISPANGLVIVLESILTYGFVRTLADGFSKTNAWSNLFGRDRFFAFLFVSVFVRMVGELWWWPALWSLFANSFGSAPDLPPGLNSVGLVLVPLTANMFWKVGLRRGSWQVGLPTLIVFLLTVYFLDPFTNLRFSEFRVHYEDAAIDMLSSPKPYIVMLVTAAIAARANLTYGWDFGGILIPALIAVIWQDPEKALVTIGEALVLAMVGVTLLESRYAKSVNLEGPRKIVVLFTLGFLLKYIFAWILQATAPHLRVIDYFGFGYLLSTLLALKIVQKKSVPGVLVPTVFVSLLGLAVSLVVISVLPISGFRPSYADRQTAPKGTTDTRSFVLGVAAQTINQPQFGEPIQPDEIGEWRKLMSAFLRPETVDSACRSNDLRELGLQCLKTKTRDGQTTYFVSEAVHVFPDGRGWGVYWFKPSSDGPAVVSRTVGGDPTRATAIVEIASDLGASIVAVSSASRTPTTARIDAEDRVASPHASVVGQIDRPIIEVDFGSQSQTLVANLPPSIDLSLVAERLQSKRKVDWKSRSREFAIRFVLSRSDVDILMSTNPGPISTREVVSVQREVEEWVFGDNASVPARVENMGSNFSGSQIHALQDGVIRPLINAAVSPASARPARRQWAAIRTIGARLGFEVERIVDQKSCWNVVREVADPIRTSALILIRCERATPVLVSIPRPHREIAVVKSGIGVAEQIGASVIIIGSAIKDFETDLRLDVIATSTVFVAAHRAFHDPDQPNAWTLQVRGVSRELVNDVDAVVGIAGPLKTGSQVPVILDWLSPHFSVTLDRGQANYVSIRAPSDETARYSRAVASERFARIWFSTNYRSRFIHSPSQEKIILFAQRSGIAVRDGLNRECRRTYSGDEEETQKVIDTVRKFALTQNPVLFEDALRRVQNEGGEAWVLRDRLLGQYWFSFCSERRWTHVKLARSTDGEVVTDTDFTAFDLGNGVVTRGVGL